MRLEHDAKKLKQVTVISALIPNHKALELEELPEYKIRDSSYWRGNILFSDYQIMNGSFPMSLFYPTFLQTKQLAYAIVMTTNNTQTQMTTFMIINIISLIISLMIYPYSQMSFNIQLIFNDMSIFVYYMLGHTFIPTGKIDQDAF